MKILGDDGALHSSAHWGKWARQVSLDGLMHDDASRGGVGAEASDGSDDDWSGYGAHATNDDY